MITINDKQYIIKYTLRALFIFEQITGRSFSINTLLDNYLFFYSLILANNDDVPSWDEFIDALDKDPSILIQISKTVEDYQKRDSIFSTDEEGEKKS